MGNVYLILKGKTKEIKNEIEKLKEIGKKINSNRVVDIVKAVKNGN